MEESLKNNSGLELIVRDLIEIGRRMYSRGYVVAIDGNLSHRLPNNKLLITKSGICKGDLKESDFIVCTVLEDGDNSNASSELPMHRTVNRLRPDVNAVIHAHPPHVVALNIAGLSLSELYLPELAMTVGSVPTAPFSVPSSAEVGTAIEPFIVSSDSIILERHGSLNVGSDIWDAFWKLERMEFAAKTLLLANQVGEVKKLTSEQLRRLKVYK